MKNWKSRVVRRLARSTGSLPWNNGSSAPERSRPSRPARDEVGAPLSPPPPVTLPPSGPVGPAPGAFGGAFTAIMRSVPEDAGPAGGCLGTGCGRKTGWGPGGVARRIGVAGGPAKPFPMQCNVPGRSGRKRRFGRPTGARTGPERARIGAPARAVGRRSHAPTDVVAASEATVPGIAPGPEARWEDGRSPGRRPPWRAAPTSRADSSTGRTARPGGTSPTTSCPPCRRA